MACIIGLKRREQRLLLESIVALREKKKGTLSADASAMLTEQLDELRELIEGALTDERIAEITDKT